MDFLFENVNLLGGFLKTKQELNEKVTIWAVYDRFCESGRFDALWCKWTPESTDIPKPHIYWDSDVAKWIEGASYIIAKHPDNKLTKIIEEAIDAIEQNQWADGYINSYYTVVRDEERFTVRDNHELYCAGHLMEAAVAYYFATGKDRFLKIMDKYADLINRIFVKEQSAAFLTPGHQEIELALLRMYDATHDEKYIDMCKYFINTRGTQKEKSFCDDFIPEYYQAEMPVRDFSEAKGHAVRACYLYTAMADLAQRTNDTELLNACQRLFNDIVNHKMYITAGIGSTPSGEAFTSAYNLPPETAYAETCAAISLMLFADKLLHIESCGIYADIIERVLYNGMMSGMSLSGDAFFYENPLEINLSNHNTHISTASQERYPITERVKVFFCSCCPPNLNRILSSLERYVYHKEADTYYVDQYVSSTLSENGITLSQETIYPSNGTVKISAKGIKRLALRIPSWCDSFQLNCAYTLKDGYAYIENPETLELILDISPRLYSASSKVSAYANRVAVMSGPVVYCAEAVDNDAAHYNLYIDKNLDAKLFFNKELGLNTIEAKGYARKGSDSLYEPFNDSFDDTTIKLIPYYAFANRGETDMAVWLNYR